MITRITLATLALAALPMAAASRCAPEANAAGGAVVPGTSCRAGLTSSQAANARAVLGVADEMGLGTRAKVIAIATTLQESGLDETTVGDGGQAVGVFQQHPHWGRNRTDPATSARRFYSRLVKVPRWDTRPLTEAAQAVQRSAFPNAYAKHETRAKKIVATLSSRSCKGAR
ncbi:hypothetical protein [Nonomuraea wenchangensis]|uniref:Mannosyl-glycoprotein endo-beta-N-acetylglucosaminidase n=1 Tax=Nonomuraea wenchangensis TaxID=568860 RepID=A0A1I0LTU3_9ACTN|nr:hypothetical protein [Nonomuraea wenchangensis]SEU46686.1 hypothetical protein SAMN05421811_127118 [Nonomuraea wenchangensis]